MKPLGLVTQEALSAVSWVSGLKVLDLVCVVSQPLRSEKLLWIGVVEAGRSE